MSYKAKIVYAGEITITTTLTQGIITVMQRALMKEIRSSILHQVLRRDTKCDISRQ